MAQTIDRSRPEETARRPVPRTWTEFDLALADARIVAELAHRIEIWLGVTSAADVQDGSREYPHDLSDRTVRELLSVIETLTRREAARLTAQPTRSVATSASRDRQ